MASGSNDKSIILWNYKTGNIIAQLNGHSKSIRSVHFSPDGTTIASGSEDKSINIWYCNTGE